MHFHVNRSQRDSIFIEDATIVSHTAHAGEQYVLRVEAPTIAAHAEPGCFAHIRCDEHLPMRRPLSLMRANPRAGWIEFLYKVVGEGTRRLASHSPGKTLSVLGPIGRGFHLDPARPRVLLLGGGVGIPPMVFLSERLRAMPSMSALVVMGSEVPFPFTLRPSTILVPGIAPGTIACMPLLEDWGIASRLASMQGFAGCYDGYLTDLARDWLQAQDEEQRSQVAIYACGPTPMMRAAALLANEYSLPCQVCLEEFMACAVGGCAGCAVRIEANDTASMKRVCVDGPVFAANEVAWHAIPH